MRKLMTLAVVVGLASAPAAFAGESGGGLQYVRLCPTSASNWFFDILILCQRSSAEGGGNWLSGPDSKVASANRKLASTSRREPICLECNGHPTRPPERAGRPSSQGGVASSDRKVGQDGGPVFPPAD